jgi:transcription factor S
MDFCKCGTLVLGNKGEIKKCPSCNEELTIGKDTNLSSKINKKTSENEIFSEDNKKEIHPLVNKPCKKCEHKKAFYWTKQTRAADEDETQFFKCEKCKHQWREY